MKSDLRKHPVYACTGGWLYLMGEDEEGKMKRAAILRTCILKLENTFPVRTTWGSLAQHQIGSVSASLSLPEELPLPFGALWLALAVEFPFTLSSLSGPCLTIQHRPSLLHPWHLILSAASNSLEHKPLPEWLVVPSGGVYQKIRDSSCVHIIF